ncbi:MAG TPA: hypothetical protein VLI41_15605 [Phenylobacterium sp.]|uniref:hypothetical protein n=1 Tax=Phenylobacterium sp. TaxID=1871053 RepID=UPI002BB09AE9|nr:hypothetical protein [Phenylobacterium sp.]HSV04621.1 hypothetical protein [Phenylobacterium sp.]
MTDAAHAIPYVPAAHPQDLVRRDLAYWGFAAQIVVLVLLQKFVLPIPGAPISLPLVTLYGWLAYMLLTSRLHVSYPRLLMVGVFFATATISQVIANRPISLLSYLELLLLYSPFVLVWKVTAQQHLRLMSVFQDAMLIGAAMVFVQLASQAAFGLGDLPSLEKFVPKFLLLQGFNYAPPIAWGDAFIRPNGFFFLEPSFASSFLAAALLIELMFFHRMSRVLVYGGALLGTVAATGILMVLIAGAPLMLARRGRAVVLAAAAGALGIVTAYYSGLLEHLTGRFAELGLRNSSGFQRLVAPLHQLSGVFADPAHLVTGLGAGNAIENGVSLWPIAKVMVEYGALPGVLFLAAMGTCMLGTANAPLALALFVAFNFTGGFLLNPVSVIQILLLVSFLAIRAPRFAVHRPAGAARLLSRARAAALSQLAPRAGRHAANPTAPRAVPPRRLA